MLQQTIHIKFSFKSINYWEKMLKSAMIVDLSTQIISMWIKDFNIKHYKITVLPSFIVYNDLNTFEEYWSVALYFLNFLMFSHD